MSLEKIVEKIISDAKAEADRITQESHKKAEEIRQTARREAEDQARLIMKEHERQGQLEASRLLTEARLKKKLELLACKKALIDEVLNKAFGKDVRKAARFKRKVVYKDEEKEESFDEAKLKDEIRLRLENDIIRVLKI
jgi:vacuolar-type H+-ATPase subunit E/Vma4